ncbi:ST13 [Symbiodinium pilosum]|uniref:ST13 protein n=1 Tax=Symbiodinium pilosum TaxID=2952 RepID=A0A812SD91_SYMPI|nr:ST13 [Symbiodinium pilosum]
MSDNQWTIKVKIVSIDNEAINSKKGSKWKAGDDLTLQIEGHATINMLKQRIALIVMAHPKFQSVSFNGSEPLDEVTKLQDVEGMDNGRTMELVVAVPPEPEAPPVVLSDDEEVVMTAEEEPLPDQPGSAPWQQELSDAEADKQGELKSQAADALEDGDLKVAVAKFTEAMMLGGVSAMMVAKRAEMLLKQKRYKAVVADASLALELNPDSAKAFRARAKARRFLGEYEASAADFAQVACLQSRPSMLQSPCLRGRDAQEIMALCTPVSHFVHCTRNPKLAG